MNIFELIKYRRSIRKYEEQQIPGEDLARIVEAERRERDITAKGFVRLLPGSLIQ